MRSVQLTLLCLAALVGCGGDAPTVPNGNGNNGGNTIPKAITVAFTGSTPGGTLNAEIAALRAARETGLMNRASIAADSGMIFIWAADQNPQTSGFWMLNTNFDLAIAFLDANKRVINIAEMTRLSTTLHFAAAPFRYAVEAPRGWFATRGIVAGATATFTVPAGVIIDP